MKSSIIHSRSRRDARSFLSAAYDGLTGAFGKSDSPSVLWIYSYVRELRYENFLNRKSNN